MSANILITSAGQRVSLVEIFKHTAAQLGCPSKVFTADLNPTMAPACYISDHSFEICRCDSPEYIERLLTLCTENDIAVVVPTIDTELLNLAAHKEKFAAAGIQVMVSDEAFIRLCRDKRETAKLFDKLGIERPAPIDKHNPRFPMFAKPYDGSLSANIHLIRHAQELTEDILNDPKLIFMDYIDPARFKEFTVDMYYGRDHRVKAIVPRERIKIRAGEINKGIALKNAIVPYLRQRMETLPGVIGTICLQLFYEEESKQIYGIEINPRFGGGYPLSYYAGANFAEYILREYVMKQGVDYSEDWKDKTLMLRYDKEVIAQL